MPSSFPADDLAKLIKAKFDLLAKKNPMEQVVVELVTGFGISRLARLDSLTADLLEVGVFGDPDTKTGEKGEIIIAHASQCVFRFSLIKPAKEEKSKEFVISLYSEAKK